MEAQGEQTRGEFQIVWGADGIAKVLGLNRRQVYHMLRNGMIKAARKCGEKHYADVAGLRAQFCSSEN